MNSLSKKYCDKANNTTRHFDPTVGRWLNGDPVGFDAGDVNLYRYVGNSPCNDSDPTVE